MSTQRFLIPVIVPSLIGLMACQFDGAPTHETSAQERLGQQAKLDLAAQPSLVRVNARDLTLQKGALVVAAGVDGTIHLQGLDVDLGNISVSPQDLPPDGLELRDVHATLYKPVVAPAEWTESGDSAFASMPVDVVLHWSFVTRSGEVAELATQRLHIPALDLRVFTASDGSLVGVATGRLDGVFFDWAELATLHDLSFDLRFTGGQEDFERPAPAPGPGGTFQ